MDIIHIRDLSCPAIIGVAERERRAPQPVLVNLRIGFDDRGAGRSDDIKDAVDYKSLKNDLLAYVAGTSFHLVEALAQGIADACLAVPGVREVTVTVDKPGALTGARSVAVEITRHARPAVVARSPRPRPNPAREPAAPQPHRRRLANVW